MITHAGGACSLLLTDRATAEKWELKIRYPKSLVDKLGLKPSHASRSWAWTMRNLTRKPPLD